MDSSQRLNKRYKITLSYDGTSYLGWQETKEGSSIEGTLKSVLKELLREDISIEAASRTDRGVHALQQVAVFSVHEMKLKDLKRSLNALLPPCIRILDTVEVPLNFHPTLDAVKKEYHYLLSYGEVFSPHERLYVWHLPYELDLSKMRQGAKHLVGSHDFSSFCNMRKNLNYSDYLRNIEKFEILEMKKGALRFEIVGNQFLYKMVRNLVGTLVYVGLSKIEPDALPQILESKSRAWAGVTAPAHGLYLKEIYYD